MALSNRAVIIGINLMDIEHPLNPRHIKADVILIDKSSGILQPLLYQFKGPAEKSGYVQLERNAFGLVGEVLSIDKEKKQIYLKNDTTVSYNHLILASGLSQTSLGSVHDNELAAGFYALNEALRLRGKVTEALTSSITPFADKHHRPSTLSSEIHDQTSVQKLLKTLQMSAISSTETSIGMDRRLYEVQL